MAIATVALIKPWLSPKRLNYQRKRFTFAIETLASSVTGKSSCDKIRMVHNPLSMSQVSGGRFPYLFNDDSKSDILLRICQENRWVGQIVGPHGSGKTTLTHWLVEHCESAFSSVVHITLRGIRPRQIQRRETKLFQLDLPAEQQRRLFVVDGIERLPWWQRRLLIHALLNEGGSERQSKIDNGLLVTTHRQLPGLKVLYQTKFDVVTLQRILDHIAQASVDQPAADVFASDQWQAVGPASRRNSWCRRTSDAYAIV